MDPVRLTPKETLKRKLKELNVVVVGLMRVKEGALAAMIGIDKQIQERIKKRANQANVILKAKQALKKVRLSIKETRALLQKYKSD